MHSRPERVGDQIRQEITELLARSVQDPGIGFVTITRVKVTPDLQLARVFYTSIGDEKAQKETVKALGRVTPFLRREIAKRIRLRRAPEIEFRHDDSIEQQATVERLLLDVREQRRQYEAANPPGDDASGDTPPASEKD